MKKLAVNEGLSQWLHCSETAVHCINKIRVVVAELFSVTPIDQTAQMQVSISDDELRQNSSVNKLVQAIEYLIASNRQVIIHSNKIPQQTFAFFKDDYNLQFENNLLKSDNGFQASLAEIKKLILEFNDKASVFGTFTPHSEQEIVINHLKGKSEEKTTSLNATQCKLFSVGLGQYAQFFDKTVEIAIKGDFQETSLEVYRHDKKNDTFYQLLQPTNYLMVEGTEGKTLNLTLQAKTEAAAVFNVKVKEANEKVSVIFSGRYELSDQVSFSQVIMQKSSDTDWECNLVINTSALNSSQSIDLQAIRRQNFNKVSIITSHLDSFKITHYFFYQSQIFSSITGNFIDYRLAMSQDGWLLILKHEHSNEETKIFLAANASIISINNIHYAIKPAAAALFAIGTENATAINSNNLLAPLEVETPFSETVISRENKLYKIGNLSLLNFSPGRTIYFDDQGVPTNYLKYKLINNQIRQIGTAAPAAILDSQQRVVKKQTYLVWKL